MIQTKGDAFFYAGKYSRVLAVGETEITVNAKSLPALQQRIDRIDDAALLYGETEAGWEYAKQYLDDKLHYAPGKHQKLMDGFRALKDAGNAEGVTAKTWQKIKPILYECTANGYNAREELQYLYISPEGFVYASDGRILVRVKLGADVSEPRDAFTDSKGLSHKPALAGGKVIDFKAFINNFSETRVAAPEIEPLHAQVATYRLYDRLRYFSGNRLLGNFTEEDITAHGIQYMLRDLNAGKHLNDILTTVPGFGLFLNARHLLHVIKLFVAAGERPELSLTEYNPDFVSPIWSSANVWALVMSTAPL
jgi:hypothetical protein